MAQKYKMTGCAKFFIFFIIAAPLSYIGASYYNGVDPFAKIKNIEIFKSNKPSPSESTKTIDISGNKDNKALTKELELKNEEIEYLKKKIDKLEDLIQTQKEELSKLSK